MDAKVNNDLVMIRATEDEHGTDYLFVKVKDLFSIGHPAHHNGIVRNQVTAAMEEYIKDMLAPGIQPIKSVFGKRWDDHGLLLPTVDDLEKLPEMRFEIYTKNLWLKNLREFEHWNGFEAYSRDNFNLNKVADDLPIIFISSVNEAEDFIPGEGGWAAFREMILDHQASGGKKIGEGSEGNIYEVFWETRPCALKIFNREAQAKLDEMSAKRPLGHLTPHFPRPNFLERIGFMQKVMGVIDSIPDLPFVISSVKEYAFGHNFILMELASGKSMAELVPDDDKPRSKEAQDFMSRKGILEEDLQPVLLASNRMDDIVSMVRFSGTFPQREIWHDFCKNNLIVQGKDRKTGQLVVRLIDQGCHNSMGCGDPWIETDIDRNLYRSARKTFEELAQNSLYDSFINSYFPDGWPLFIDEHFGTDSEEAQKLVAE